MTEQTMPTTTSSDQSKVMEEEQLFCSLTGKPVSREEAYWAPPFITARDLVVVIFRTITQSPGALGQLLFAAPVNVPYAPDAREQLASRRSSEQIKLLLGLLLIVALIAVPIILLSMG
ncbi:MAG: hypothetical protein GFH27_549281n263 [Chloroflexi bacterium AL-W]|nr:hypothetical protein [Chloroflexi bacterium AL-N1]NOK66148.1 hypothetical protein [Chloroflexi bacterium AL-N10]NOK73029.1 hypothetical protein [Chloroflexi bacterium AL-N5]NOK79926.1 hypothetical protein [Chloroflexi bacterium AL-W]NOK88218.1 hypothetical protein [Chloroflexi bacterium AL-N15]